MVRKKNEWMNKVTREYIILVLVVLLLAFSIYHFFRQNKIESFDIMSASSIVFDNGISDNSTSSGSIKFAKTFTKIPSVFSQIIGNDDNNSPTDIYSVQILNPTVTGFDYVKTKIYKKTNESKTVMMPSLESTMLPFNWIAIQF